MSWIMGLIEILATFGQIILRFIKASDARKEIFHDEIEKIGENHSQDMQEDGDRQEREILEKLKGK